MATALEINIRSLIVQCEDLVKDDTNNWLLKKYIRSLDTMINELENGTEYVYPVEYYSISEKKTPFHLPSLQIAFTENQRQQSSMNTKRDVSA